MLHKFGQYLLLVLVPMNKHLLMKERPIFPSFSRELITVTVSILVRYINTFRREQKAKHSMVGDSAKMRVALVSKNNLDFSH